MNIGLPKIGGEYFENLEQFISACLNNTSNKNLLNINNEIANDLNFGEYFIWDTEDIDMLNDLKEHHPNFDKNLHDRYVMSIPSYDDYELVSDNNLKDLINNECGYLIYDLLDYYGDEFKKIKEKYDYLSLNSILIEYSDIEIEYLKTLTDNNNVDFIEWVFDENLDVISLHNNIVMNLEGRTNEWIR